MNKSRFLIPILLLILSLLLVNNLALASGDNPPAPLSQSSTPTATHQVYMPLMGNPPGEQAGSAQGSSPLTNWLLGAGLLVVLVVVYVVLTRTRRKK